MLQLAVPIHRLAVALNPRSLQLWRCVGVASKQLTAYFGQPNSSICRCYATPFSTAVPYRDTSDPQLSSQFIMPVGLKKFFPEGSAWDEINVGQSHLMHDINLNRLEFLQYMLYDLRFWFKFIKRGCSSVSVTAEKIALSSLLLFFGYLFNEQELLIGFTSHFHTFQHFFKKKMHLHLSE